MPTPEPHRLPLWTRWASDQVQHNKDRCEGCDGLPDRWVIVWHCAQRSRRTGVPRLARHLWQKRQVGCYFDSRGRVTLN